MKAQLTLRIFVRVPFDESTEGNELAGNKLGVQLCLVAWMQVSIPCLPIPGQTPVSLRVWFDDDLNDCGIKSVNWELVDNALMPHIVCQFDDELNWEPEVESFESKRDYQLQYLETEVRNRLRKQGFTIGTIYQQVYYEKTLAESLEKLLEKPVETTGV